MASIKVLKMLHEKQERNSLVKDLIALRPITPIVIKESHPLQAIYEDPIPPLQPVDQFAPYLSRKLESRRKERIEKIKGKNPVTKPTYVLGRDTQTATSAKRRPTTSTAMQRYEEESLEAPSSQPTAEQSKSSASSLQTHLQNEATFDRIAANAAGGALHKLVEQTLQVHFLAERVLFFHDIASINVLYCPSTTAYCPHGSGIVGYTQFTRNIVITPCACQHAAYMPTIESTNCPPHSRVLCFPIFDYLSNVRGIIQVLRNDRSPEFGADDVKFVEYFQNKMKMYSKWLFQPVIDEQIVSNMIRVSRMKDFVESTCEKLTRMFGCRIAELWNMNTETNQIQKYSTKSNQPIDVSVAEAGIVGFALKNQLPVSCVTSKVHSSYNPKQDGNGEYSFLAIPVRDPDSAYLYCLALRGKRIPQFFTDQDERILARVAPYIITALHSSQLIENNHKSLKDSIHQQKRLRALLEVAETLSGQLRMEELIGKIMSQACDLVKADRCSLFMVNEARDKLVTSFQGGLANSIEIPIHAGIVGYTATTGKILNIHDAYQDSRFNRATDLATGYRTLTLLCVPIFDEKGEIRGVTEMINKIDGVFTEEDEKMIKIFNVFTGISIENARLYRASIDLSLQLRSFLEISHSLSQPQTIKKMMEEIIKNTRKVVGAVTGSLFMVEDTGLNFEPYVTDEDFSVKAQRAADLKKKNQQEDALSVKRSIIQRIMQGKPQNYDPEIAKQEEIRNEFLQVVVAKKESILENDDANPERSFMMVPITSSDRLVMGVVVMQWKKNSKAFTYDDLKLLESYSVFLSISLERSRLKTIAQLGSQEVEMQVWIGEDERGVSGVPKKLELTDSEKAVIWKPSFDASQMHLFKTMFHIYHEFDLFRTFNISNDVFYYFLYELRASYNQVPYHNWMHAVDVTQFMAFLLRQSKFDVIFSRFEILCMLTACVCHDANHDGFTNQYNVKAQTPLGILFKNQSVMETHHCSVSIGILTRDECNIFSSLNDSELTEMWSLFVTLILATDMAQHFVILDQAKALGSDWMKYKDGRVLMMEMLIKVADVSNVSRPFSLADRWYEILCEEFFRQGDLEKASGMEYCSPMNDREHLDKAKSQIGFYQCVCLPMFKQMVTFSENFAVCLEQVLSNLKAWETRAL